MRRVVINREVDKERWASFLQSNGHVGLIERVDGVEGQTLCVDDLVKRGVAETGLRYTQGAWVPLSLISVCGARRCSRRHHWLFSKMTPFSAAILSLKATG
ncbi:hypothetical protein [Asaia platycodi]|uniref:hypothetical protein n=1 Tax=Asaia platycodi TaxID=610243 RepID=UPI000A86DEF4|nr:hypothetical protein [Asaia platycodi]